MVSCASDHMTESFSIEAPTYRLPLTMFSRPYLYNLSGPSQIQSCNSIKETLLLWTACRIRTLSQVWLHEICPSMKGVWFVGSRRDEMKWAYEKITNFGGLHLEKINQTSVYWRNMIRLTASRQVFSRNFINLNAQYLICEKDVLCVFLLKHLQNVSSHAISNFSLSHFWLMWSSVMRHAFLVIPFSIDFVLFGQNVILPAIWRNVI